MKSSNIGGQAVLEGIMMKNRETYSVAVRKPDGEIEVDIQEYKGVLPWKAPQKIPFIRGIFNFVDSLVLGMKTLTYSASFFEDEEEEILTEDEARKQEKKEKLIMNLTVVVSVLIAVGIFMVLPYYLSSIIEKHTSSQSRRISSLWCNNTKWDVAVWSTGLWKDIFCETFCRRGRIQLYVHHASYSKEPLC